MCYRTRYRTFSLRFSWFWAVCSGLPCVTAKFIKKHIYYFLKKIDTPTLSKAQRKCMVTRAVTRSSHGNALHYGLIMFVEFENLSYPKVVSNMTQFQSHFTSLPTCSFQIN